MQVVTVQELIDPLFINNNVDAPNKNIKVKLDDGHIASMPMRTAILHSILWEPYFTFNIPITNNEIYAISAVTTETVSKIQTIQYKHLMNIIDVPYMDIIASMWNTINNLYRFVFIKLASYQRSISVLELIKIINHPKLKELIHTDIPSNMGTKVAEVKFAQKSKELLDILSDPNAIAGNPLSVFMSSGILNKNQIPQLLMHYGTRSDLDDQMMKHVINASALSGLCSPKDLATESLSAKKTAYYLSVVIANTQYFARVLRLSNMQFRFMHKGDCGSKYLLPITINKGQGENFIHKVVFHNGNRIEITDKNYKEVEGCRVEMISPIGCNHLDGVCERCAGRTTKFPWAYLPKVHLGSYAKSKLSAKISQKVLSAKHLIKTTSMEPKLLDIAKQYFHKEPNTTNIFLAVSMVKKLKNTVLIVSAENMNHISDLQFGPISADSFSLLEHISIKDKNTEHIENIELADSQFMLHLSEDMLEHMRNISADIEIIDGAYHIPLDGFKINKPIISYVVVNDDMVAFSERIKAMIKDDLRQYTCVADALSDLANIVYSKTELNIFWLELIVRSLMTDVVGPEGQVQFSKIRDGIINSSVATKLGHEDIRRYLQLAETTVVAKFESPLDPFFAF